MEWWGIGEKQTKGGVKFTHFVSMLYVVHISEMLQVGKVNRIFTFLFICDPVLIH